jgi:hypothetical protein
MGDNFYLTELNHAQSTKLDKSLAKHVSSYLVKNSEKFEQTTSNFLDFMINEHTRHTDLSKIEEYFQAKGVENYQKYNTKVDLIQKRRKILQDLDNIIEEVKNTY